GHRQGQPRGVGVRRAPGPRDVRARGRERAARARGVPPRRAQARRPDAVPRAWRCAVKGLQAKDLRGNDPAELRSTRKKLEEDLFKHRLKKNTNQLENTALIRNTRRDMARVQTVLAERVKAEKAAAKEKAK